MKKETTIMWENVCKKLRELRLPNLKLNSDGEMWFGENIFPLVSCLEVTKNNNSSEEEILGTIDYMIDTIGNHATFSDYDSFLCQINRFLIEVQEEDPISYQHYKDSLRAANDSIGKNDEPSQKQGLKKFLIQAKVRKFSTATETCIIEDVTNACSRYQELSKDHEVVNMQILQV